jgi:aldehyde:ferredoxin oxidoreductase
MALGKSILNNEMEFNRKAGFSSVHDQLPEMFTEAFPPHDTQWDFSTDELTKTLSF